MAARARTACGWVSCYQKVQLTRNFCLPLKLNYVSFSSARSPYVSAQKRYPREFLRKSRTSKTRAPISFPLATNIFKSIPCNKSATISQNASDASSIMSSYEEYLSDTTGDKKGFISASPTEDLISLLELMQSNKFLFNYELISDIESVMLGRLRSTRTETLLRTADNMFRLQYRCSKFYTVLFNLLNENFDSLIISPKHFIRLMFHVYFYGSVPPAMLEKVEDFALQNCAKFTINDFGIICLGFFRSNRRIASYNLLNAISERLIKDFETVDNYHLTNILKAFRHSNFMKKDFYETLGSLLVESRLGKVKDLNSVMHIVMAYACLHVYHEELFNMISKTLEEMFITRHSSRSTRFRSKDIAKTVWALGTMRSHPGEQLLTAMVRRFEEARRLDRGYFPESLVDILMGLAYLEVFPDKFLHEVFNLETACVLRDQRYMEKQTQLLYLHHTIRIENPQATCQRLPESFLKPLSDDLHGDLQFEFSVRAGLASTYEALQDLLRPDQVECHFILPHFKTPDIEIRLNDKSSQMKIQLENQPKRSDVSGSVKKHTFQLSVTQELLQQKDLGTNTQIKKASYYPALKDDAFSERRFIVEVVGTNQCTVDCDRLLGLFNSKVRQLRKLGYDVIVIMPPQAKYIDDMEPTARKQYLQENVLDQLNADIKYS